MIDRGNMHMFDFLKKKKNVPDNSEKRHLLNLPVITEKENSPEKIAEYLKNGIPIWAWYNAKDKCVDENGNWNVNALLTLEKGWIDGFAMFRKEDDFLCKYTLEIFEKGEELHLRLDQIREFKNSNIMEIYNGDLHEAYELYHDDENVAATMSFYCHNITSKEAKKYLTHNRIMYVNEENFIKKSENA